MKKSIQSIFLLLVICLSACKQDTSYKAKLNDADVFHSSMKQLTDVIVHDIFSPPVASRIYAYPSIAAYEIMSQSSDEYQSLAGQLNELKPIPVADTTKNFSFEIAAIHAFLNTGKALIFSEDKIENYIAELDQKYKDLKVPNAVVENSKNYGQSVAEHMIAWANGDNYNQTRSMPKFEIQQTEKYRWKPTPPVYMEAIEPHWNQIRPFVLEDIEKFRPEPPTEFDLNKGSKFFKEVEEVYEVVKNAGKEEKDIASFWDCNPYVVNLTGHAMYALKKITPGGHWIGICKIACQKSNADFMKTCYTYALTSISLSDAFISCWDEKYRSNLLRPETVINEQIDPDWKPILQTPPFPEYTSGHSVISTAAALSLTHIYGDNFQFDDTTEIEYGMPMRSFNSFMGAAEEAAVSRLYGGIHYRPAIDFGVDQGRTIGNHIIKKLVFKK